jgi:hypothetical protein
MKKTLKKLFKRHMIRPIIYMVFTRAVLGLTTALLWNEFVNIRSVLPMRTFAFLFLGIFFLVMGWMAYLRLDGIRMPTFDKGLFEWKHKPKRTYGDMIDYVGENVVSFDDLEDDEKDACRLAADLICGAVFLLLTWL